jgi:hypothetical protein
MNKVEMTARIRASNQTFKRPEKVNCEGMSLFTRTGWRCLEKWSLSAQLTAGGRFDPDRGNAGMQVRARPKYHDSMDLKS